MNYAAYVPFEQALPWSGRWDDLPAAHAAAIAFDLLCLGLLFLIGRRMRGPTLGLRARLRVGGQPLHALRDGLQRQRRARGRRSSSARSSAASSPAGRGALIALAGMAKFAPLALAPLFATYTRGAWRFVARRRAALVPCLLLVLGYGGLHEFYDRTLAFQASRGSPFSIWGLYGWDTAQAVVQAAGVLLAVAVAFVPRRARPRRAEALAAAVLIALQLGVTHWFYLYMVWFLGPLLIALLADAEPAERHGPPHSYAEELGRLPAPAVAWR